MLLLLFPFCFFCNFFLFHIYSAKDEIHSEFQIKKYFKSNSKENKYKVTTFDREHTVNLSQVFLVLCVIKKEFHEIVCVYLNLANLYRVIGVLNKLNHNIKSAVNLKTFIFA